MRRRVRRIGKKNWPPLALSNRGRTIDARGSRRPACSAGLARPQAANQARRRVSSPKVTAISPKMLRRPFSPEARPVLRSRRAARDPCPPAFDSPEVRGRESNARGARCDRPFRRTRENRTPTARSGRFSRMEYYAILVSWIGRLSRLAQGFPQASVDRDRRGFHAS